MNLDSAKASWYIRPRLIGQLIVNFRSQNNQRRGYRDN